MPKDDAQQQSLSSNTSQDIPVEIIGYVTDPKRVGYQILTNYESTYWRALVGNEAWGLFEALRSFCHEGNDTCRPSISLLTDILGVSDRRHITGRVRIVDGKEYNTPGLIDVLQEHDLAVAEVKGKGAKLRYVFHVNLTPGVIPTDQLLQLPSRLQKKHAALLKRVAQEQEKLSDKVEKKKPRKKSKREQRPVEGQDEGMDNVQRGMDNVHTPPGQYPHRTTPIQQYPLTTTEAEGEGNNNNSSGELQQKQDVVVALTDLGISKSVSKRLARRYSRERVFEKIDFLAFVQERDPEKIKNPRGWLRTAIEKNYGPPDGYKPKAQREAEAAQERREAEQAAREQEAWEERQRERREAEQRCREEELARLNERYGTTQHELDLWEEALGEIKLRVPRPTYQRWFPKTQLLLLENGVATIGVLNDQTKDWLEHRLASQIRQVFRSLDEPVEELAFEVLSSDFFVPLDE